MKGWRYDCQACLARPAGTGGCGQRHFIIRCERWGARTRAARSAAAAKWQDFKAAREAGYFSHDRYPFRTYLQGLPTAYEARS